MKAHILNGNLHIELPISMSQSKSGKSKVIASSHGNQALALEVDGKATVVKIGVNAFIQ